MSDRLHASQIKRAILSRGRTAEECELSMLHMRHTVTGEYEPTAAMKWGTILHAAILSPDRLAVYPGGRRAGKAWKAFEAEHAGKIIVTEPERERIGQAQAAFGAGSGVDLRQVLTEVEAEADIEGCGPMGGRIDILGPQALWDLKTTGNVGRRQVMGAACQAGTDVQLAVYRALAFFGRHPAIAGFVCLESAPPWTCYAVEFSPSQLDEAWALAAEIVRMYRACEACGTWPQAVQQRIPYEPPAWMTDLGDVPEME